MVQMLQNRILIKDELDEIKATTAEPQYRHSSSTMSVIRRSAKAKMIQLQQPDLEKSSKPPLGNFLVVASPTDASI
jgi:hypothetical protein